ncbi:thiamine-phosphate kinase [Phenylobacterium montanum]|uniref:Thiamine-monophosphate kinase n=2 Tax=Phenylobacterium montanum TaxID=2823693 RepID=A0A975G0Q5_9CAUL|nr:thiamine-phosphate kinase [Caulobacter sp. S6]QUD88978.1 thiamine-phosphate kinase [Caulobacter sp. S6]
MSGPDQNEGPVDEFDWIRRCLMPLAGAPEALGLLDDAAVVPSRPGFDLVITKDALVEGVHFLPDDPLDGVAGKLIRVNLSDLAAKGAEPYGYLLATAWPKGTGWAPREAFARGLAEDQQRFGLTLLGGDTVSTPGPFVVSLTLLGWVPQGGMVRRSGARPGDVVLVSGTIGDGWLGLKAAQGGLAELSTEDRAWLAGRYRKPEPRLALASALKGHATAAADVSDGLIADAGRIAIASDIAVELDLEHAPLSEPAARWLAGQGDRDAGLLALAAGGDDYEVVCTARESCADALVQAAAEAGVRLVRIGRVGAGQGVETRLNGRLVTPERAGYRHG